MMCEGQEKGFWCLNWSDWVMNKCEGKLHKEFGIKRGVYKMLIIKEHLVEREDGNHFSGIYSGKDT